MISKQVVDPKTRLEPMLRDALERLSFGIEIISIQVFDDMIAVGGPPRPCVIMAIMCKGTIIGPNGYIGQAVIVTDFWSSQEQVDGYVQGAVEDVRKTKAQQNVLGNGHGSIGQGPTMPYRPREQ